MVIEHERMRFTVERYEHMVEAGILTPDDRVELIDGEIVEMTPIGPDHSTIVELLMRSFVGGVGDRASIRVQSPVRLPPDSEPEPDLWLAEPGAERYRARHPAADDLFLVVEVADTTHRRDRVKLGIYAAAGIREAWLVDIPARRIEVHRDPGPDGYRAVRTIGPGESVSPLAFPDVTVAVDDVLGPS